MSAPRPTSPAASAELPQAGQPDRAGSLEWPASPWDASAPESYVLLHFQQRPQAREALKLGLLELIARRALRLVEAERKGFFRRVSTVSLLVPGPGPGGTHRDPADAAGPAIRPLWETFRAQDEGETEGVEVKRFAGAVVKRFGTVDGYVEQAVRPALAGRGWLTRERYRILGVFPATRWRLTPDGTAAQGDLLWRVQYGNRELGRLVDDDPARAIAFAGLAGAAVLLMDDARPHLQRLKEHLAAGSQPAGGSGSGGGDSGSSSSDTGVAGRDGMDGMDGGLDLGAVDAIDLGALDAVDAAVDAVDSGVDAGTDGGGGDGGGGDGGGGGGGGD